MLFFVLCKFVLSTHEMLLDWMNVTYSGTQEEQALTIKRLEAYKLYVQSFLFTKEWTKIINDKFPEITSSQAEQMDSQDFKTNVLVLTESLGKIITRAKTVDLLFKSNDSHGMKEAALRLNSDDFENITLTFDNEFLKEVFVPLTAKFSDPNNFSGNPEQEVSFMRDLFRDLGLDKISVFVKTFIKELAKNDSTSSEDVNEAKSAPILPAENPSLGD